MLFIYWEKSMQRETLKHILEDYLFLGKPNALVESVYEGTSEESSYAKGQHLRILYPEGLFNQVMMRLKHLGVSEEDKLGSNF